MGGRVRVGVGDWRLGVRVRVRAGSKAGLGLGRLKVLPESMMSPDVSSGVMMPSLSQKCVPVPLT